MSIRSVRSSKKIYRTTFTYFIPSPPHRKTGYREVEFDKIMQGLMSTGFEIETIQTQTTESGLFVMALLKTTSKKVFDMDAKLDMHDRFKLAHTHSSPDIILEEDEDV